MNWEFPWILFGIVSCLEFKCTRLVTSCDCHGVFVLVMFTKSHNCKPTQHERIAMNPSRIVRLLTHSLFCFRQAEGAQLMTSRSLALDPKDIFSSQQHMWWHNFCTLWFATMFRSSCRAFIIHPKSHRTKALDLLIRFANVIRLNASTSSHHPYLAMRLITWQCAKAEHFGFSIWEKRWKTLRCPAQKEHTHTKKLHQTLLQQNEFVKSLVPLRNDWIWCSQTFLRCTTSAGAFISFLCAEGAIATSARCFPVALGVHMCNFLLLLFCTTCFLVNMLIYVTYVHTFSADYGPLPVCYTFLQKKIYMHRKLYVQFKQTT